MTSDDVRRKLVAAAREKFLSEDYDVFADITVKDAAKDAGVSLRTARDCFKIDELKDALAEDILQLDPVLDMTPEEFEDFTARIVDRSRPLGAELGDIVSFMYEHNLTNPMMRAVNALWAFSPGSPENQKRLAELYLTWLRLTRNGLFTLFMERSDQFALRRDWISIDDFVRAMNAVVEGLAIQQQPFRQLEEAGEPVDLPAGIAPIDPDLVRKVMAALLTSMLDTGQPSPAEILDDL